MDNEEICAKNDEEPIRTPVRLERVPCILPPRPVKVVSQSELVGIKLRKVATATLLSVVSVIVYSVAIVTAVFIGLPAVLMSIFSPFSILFSLYMREYAGLEQVCMAWAGALGVAFLCWRFLLLADAIREMASKAIALARQPDDVMLASDAADALPVAESLVRASQAPVSEQRKVLLRPALGKQDVAAEQLVRASSEMGLEGGGGIIDGTIGDGTIVERQFDGHKVGTRVRGTGESADVLAEVGLRTG